MREQEFKEWLLNGQDTWNPSEDTIRIHYIPNLLKVEDAEGDLDVVCKNEDGLEGLWNRYEYTEERAIADWGRLAIDGSQNPVNMRMHPALLLSHLTTYRSRINQYKAFCEQHPPA